MIHEELGLILFGLLLHLSVGAVLMAALLPLLTGRRQPGDTAFMQKGLLYVALPAVVVGLLASLLHLGTPSGAYRAVLNLGSSWLSREILFSVIFALLCLVAAWQKGAVPAVNWGATVAGLLAVLANARIYQASIKPAWSTFFTPASFFTATALLGVVALGGVLAYGMVRKAVSGATAGLLLGASALIGLVAVAVQLASAPLYAAVLGSGPEAGQESLALLTGSLAWLWLLRSALGVAGVAILALAWRAENQGKVPAALMAASLLGIAVAEVLARVLFYATGIPITVG